MTGTVDPSRPGPSRQQDPTPEDGDCRTRGPGTRTRAGQTRRKINVPLVPPKPNEFEIATSILRSRAVCGT